MYVISSRVALFRLEALCCALQVRKVCALCRTPQIHARLCTHFGIRAADCVARADHIGFPATRSEVANRLRDIARPVAPDATTSFKETFARFWRTYPDDIIMRDLAWVQKVHPQVHTV